MSNGGCESGASVMGAAVWPGVSGAGIMATVAPSHVIAGVVGSRRRKSEFGVDGSAGRHKHWAVCVVSGRDREANERVVSDRQIAGLRELSKLKAACGSEKSATLRWWSSGSANG